MLDASRYASPLPDSTPAHIGAPGIDLRAVPFPNVISLRADAASRALSAAGQRLGLELTMPVIRATAAQGRAALRIGPDEWLIDTGSEKASIVAEELCRSLGQDHASIIDISDGVAAFDIAGAHAVDLLRKGCAIDLHPAAFAADTATRTALAQATIVLWCLENPRHWRFYVDRSFAGYIWAWLRDAGQEFSVG